jgi:hypothetical protein
LVDQTFFQWLTGKAVNASSVAQHRLQLAELPAQHPRDHIELLMDMGGIRLGENRADGGRDHLGRPLGHLGQDVAEEVDPAALYRRAGYDGADGLAQVEASAMTCTPVSPRAFKLRRNWVQKAPSSLSPTAKPSTSRRPSPHTPGGHHHCLGDHAAVDPGLAVSGVHEHIREGLAGQGAAPEGRHLAVEARTLGTPTRYAGRRRR